MANRVRIFHTWAVEVSWRVWFHSSILSRHPAGCMAIVFHVAIPQNTHQFIVTKFRGIMQGWISIFLQKNPRRVIGSRILFRHSRQPSQAYHRKGMKHFRGMDSILLQQTPCRLQRHLSNTMPRRGIRISGGISLRSHRVVAGSLRRSIWIYLFVWVSMFEKTHVRGALYLASMS